MDRPRTHKVFKHCWRLKRKRQRLWQRLVNVHCIYPFLIIIIFLLIQIYWITIDRVQRLKDARTEAVKEIDALKAQKAKEFEEFDKQVI